MDGFVMETAPELSDLHLIVCMCCFLWRNRFFTYRQSEAVDQDQTALIYAYLPIGPKSGRASWSLRISLVNKYKPRVLYDY